MGEIGKKVGWLLPNDGLREPTCCNSPVNSRPQHKDDKCDVDFDRTATSGVYVSGSLTILSSKSSRNAITVDPRPISFIRHHLSYDDCLEDKREDCQNCSVLCCVHDSCIHNDTNRYEQSSVGFTLKSVFCAFV